MNPNPFNSLLHSRKFWLMVFDTVVSLALYFIGKYVPSAAEDVKYVIFGLQPVVIAVIVGIFVEDAAEKGNAPQG